MGTFFEYLLQLFVRMPWWGQLATVAVLLVMALLLSLRFVKEGERGLVLRFGQVVRKNGKPRIMEPGFLFLVPKVDSLVRRHVRQQTIELNEQEVILKDNTIWVVSAVVFFRVKDIYKALFEIDDLDGGVRNLCMGELRTVLQNLPKYEAIKEIDSVSRALMDSVARSADEWGIEIINFRLTNCMPTAETATFVTAQTAVSARVKALQDAGVLHDPQLAAALLGAPVVASLGRRSGDGGAGTHNAETMRSVPTVELSEKEARSAEFLRRAFGPRSA
jgi:regulator of protease activity HflC (stomatin/prohibitin superfamily)